MGKVSSRRKSKLPLGRPPYLFSEFTTPPRPAPRATPPPADPFDSAETKSLRWKLHELQLEGGKLIPRENLLKRKVRVLRWKMDATQTSLFDWERRSSLPYGVIPFVAAINEADRYFEFKKAAIKKYRKKIITQWRSLLPLDIQRILRDDEELNSKFNRRDDLELAEAAIAIFYKLHAEQEKKHRIDPQNCLFHKREDPALSRPIYNLVFQTRKHGIVMDQNPVVELEKIMKYNPSLYDACFLLEAPPENYLMLIKEAHDSYTKFWSKYAKAASGTEPSVLKAEDADSRFPFAGADPRSSVNLMKKLEALDIKLDKLLVKKKMWDARCQEVLDRINLTKDALWESERRSALPYAVIPFVAEIEEANLYFEFKKAAKEKYRQRYNSTGPYLLPFDISNILRNDEELNSKFKDFSGFQEAALAIFNELGFELRCMCPKSSAGVHKNCGFIRRKDPILVQPIYKLVFQARKKYRVMDEDPIVELEKIMESNPSLYDAYFNVREEQVDFSAYFNTRGEQVDFSAYFDRRGKPVDCLETAVREAKIKYSEIWSTYFKAAGAKTKRRKMVDHGKDVENRSRRPCIVSH